MPKIEVNESLFFSLLGRRCEAVELEEILPGAKAELDEWDVAGEGQGGEAGVSQAGSTAERRLIKIELNDTNRPDLWSTAGLARALRIRETGKRPDYPFFSREGRAVPAKRKVVVEASVKEVRPFLAGFFVSGKSITDAILKDIIQTQEKLCWNFGRKRRSVSMGIYRSATIEWPIRYKAVAPDSVRFVPLQGDRPMTLTEILREHPKGREYGFINEPFKLHPLLTDSKGAVLSYPPIINSNDLGAVKVGDDELFVELTGTDLASVTLSASIVSCDFADLGFTVEPVKVEYPYETAFGSAVTFPYYFQVPVSVEAAKVSKLLGMPFSVQATRDAVERMGSATESHGQYVTVFPPEYRNDFLHAVDIVEDVMMGKGMAFFEPERPRDFTIGRLSPIELFSRKAKAVLVGLGRPGDDLRLSRQREGPGRPDGHRRRRRRSASPIRCPRASNTCAARSCPISWARSRCRAARLIRIASSRSARSSSAIPWKTTASRRGRGSPSSSPTQRPTTTRPPARLLR